MQQLPSLRHNLSEEVAAVVRQMIVDGQLAADQRINEVQLAARLGVSRTPLREALGRLEAEGAVATRPRFGVFVRPLTLDEYRQIYPIRALLDPEALRLAGIPSPDRLRRLTLLNREMRRSTDPEDVLRADDTWHLELLEACPNKVLIDLITAFIRRARRYELALMRDGRQVEVSTREHDQILKALRAGNLRRACARLRANMLTGTDAVVAWLASRTDDVRTASRPAPISVA
jgi:DNA-binding GntR family transcriptional regulator